MKFLFAVILLLVASRVHATTWEKLAVSAIYKASDVVVFVKVEKAESIYNGDVHCGVRYTTSLKESFKGEAQKSIVFYGYGGPSGFPVGTDYLLFLRAGDTYQFGMASTNSVSMDHQANFLEKCNALRQGLEPLGGYGSLKVDFPLSVRHMALEVQEDFVEFPSSIKRYPDKFNSVQELYGTAWIKLSDALTYMRTLKP